MGNFLFALLGLVIGGGGVGLFIALPLIRKLESSEKKLKRASRAAEDQSSQTEALQTAQAKIQATEASYQTQIQGYEQRIQNYEQQIADYEQQIEVLRQAQADVVETSPAIGDEQGRVQELEQSYQAQIEQLRLDFETEKQALIQSHQRELEELQNRQSNVSTPAQELQSEASSPGFGLGSVVAGGAAIAGVAGLAGAAVSGLFQKETEETPPVSEEISTFETPVADELEIPHPPVIEELPENESPFGGADFEIPSPPEIAKLSESPFETPEFQAPESPELVQEVADFGGFEEQPIIEEHSFEEQSFDAFGEQPFVEPAEIANESPFDSPSVNWVDEDAVTEMPEIPVLETPVLSWNEEEAIAETPEIPVLTETEEISAFWEEPPTPNATIEQIETLAIDHEEDFHLGEVNLEAFGDDVQENWVDAPAAIGETLEVPEELASLESNLEESGRSPFGLEENWGEEIASSVQELELPEAIATPEVAEVGSWQEPDFSPFGQLVETSEESSFDLSELELEGNWVDEEPFAATPLPTAELESWLDREEPPAPSFESSESTFDINELDLAENWITETPESTSEIPIPTLELENWLETPENPALAVGTEAILPIIEELEESNSALELPDDFLSDIAAEPASLLEEPGIAPINESLDLSEDFLAGIPSEHPNLELLEELGTDSDLDFLLELQAEESDPSPAILSFSETAVIPSDLPPSFVDDELPLLDLFSSEQDEIPELPISNEGGSEPFINFLDTSSEKSDVEFLEMLQNDDSSSASASLSDDDDIFGDLFAQEPVSSSNPAANKSESLLSDKAPSEDHSSAENSFEQLFSEASSLDNWDLPNLDDPSHK